MRGATRTTAADRWYVVLPVAALGVLALAYSSAALAPAGAPSSGWWPAAGFAIALTALSSRPAAYLVPVVTLPATTVALWLAGRPWDLALAFAVGHTLEVAVAGLLMRQVLARLRVSSESDRSGAGGRTAVRLDELRWIGVVGIIGAAIIAGVACMVIVLAGLPGGLEALRNVFVTHLAGTLLIVTAALTLPGSRIRAPRWETAAQATVLLGVMALTLGSGPATGLLALAPLPLLVWAGLRLGTRVVIVELFVLAIAITVAARLGTGPFRTPADDVALGYLFAGLVQSYVICAILTALPLAVSMDQRRELLERVLDSERVLRRSFSDSVVGMLELLDDGEDLRVVDLNDVAMRTFGGRRDEVLGRRLGDLLDLDTADLRRTVVGGGPWRADVGLRSRPQARIGLAVSAARGPGANEGASAQMVDLTPVEEAHQRADRERELSRAVAETAACLILLVDVDGVLVAANPAATTMLGWSEDDLVGRFVWELLPADRQGDLRRSIAGLPDSPMPKTSEADLLCRDGGRRRVLWSTDFARDPDGSPTLLVMTGIDVTAERRQQLLVSQLLEATMTTAIIGVDADGAIAFFNTGAERLLGRSATEAVGTPFVDVLHPDEQAERYGVGAAGETAEEAFFRVTLDVEPGRAPVPEDLRWQSADGTVRTVSTTLSMVADPDLGVGFLCIGRDVTEQRETQQLLMRALDKERTAVERLRALDHAKNDFVSTVSHELRTPVTSIVGYAEMLRDGTVDEPRPDQAPFLAAIARNADRLIGLADDLLTLSGLESGSAELGREQVDLGTLVRGSEETLTPLLRDRDLAMTYRVADVPVLVSGDAAHLDRVLVNLVGNAVKFTDDGGRIEVSVSAEAGEAVLSVADTGIGIPADEQARLFTKFFRSTTAQQRAIQGTGLGLSIVHSIVAAHGGRILVRSAHLAGTTFSVRLPLQEARPAATTDATSERPEVELDGQSASPPAARPEDAALSRGSRPTPRP